jgi:enhancer of polycomb-like protein
MTEEDDVFLKIMNEKRDVANRCTEDQFEEVMNFFEETARLKQPFAAVDNPPVLSFAEMQESMDATVEETVKRFAKDIYEHWKSIRTNNENRPLLASLKVCQNVNQPCTVVPFANVGLQFETGQETDDTDPYVCFRRREVRQIRKTRGRDAQSADKLRRLRKELEDARQLVALVRQRELARKEMLATERVLFLQRAEVKDMKRKLNIKDDDEDLINQKVRNKGFITHCNALALTQEQPKKKPTEAPTISHPPSGGPIRISSKPGTQAAEDLQLLETFQAEKENEILRDIKANIAKHIKWNEGYVDFTRAPLSPSPERTFDASFRPAITTQLPTPPSSASSEHMMMDTSLDTPGPISFRDKLAAHALMTREDANKIPSFRRRIGRGGRLLIDRRNLASKCKVELDPWKADRFKYDQEDSDEDLDYEMDQYDIQLMQNRAIMLAKARDQAHAQAQAAQARRLQAEQAAAQNAVSNTGQTMGSNPGPGAIAPVSET